MTIDSSCSISNEIVSYLIGEASEQELSYMEMHLLNCSSCRKELQEMKEAWNLLPYDLDEIEVPADLKDEVMNAIFQTKNPKHPPIDHNSLKEMTKKVVHFRKGFNGLAAAALLLCLGGVIWNNINLREQVTELRAQTKVSPEVIQIYSLNTTNPASDSAQGNALLYKQGDKVQIVFQFKGLADTKGTEAYQAWLIEDGKRKSAGTFHVDNQGNGYLTYEFPNKEISFETIGISLEPDAKGTQPRGKKVLGT